MINFSGYRHNLSLNWLRNMIFLSTNTFSGIGNWIRAISKPPDNRVARSSVDTQTSPPAVIPRVTERRSACQSPPTHWITNFVVILIFGWYIYIIIIMYLEAAVATVFEIATFPLAKVLHSRSIENGFFSFWKKNSKIFFWKKPPKW